MDIVDAEKEARIVERRNKLERSRLAADSSRSVDGESSTQSFADIQIATSKAEIAKFLAASNDAVRQICIATEDADKERHRVEAIAALDREERLNSAEIPIVRNWNALNEQLFPEELVVEMKNMKDAYAAVMKAKDFVIKSLEKELEGKDEEYKHTLNTYRGDIKNFVSTLEKQYIDIETLYSEHIEKIEEAYMKDRKEIIDSNRKELDALFEKRRALEAQFAEDHVNRENRFAAELNDMQTIDSENYSRLKTKLETDVAILEQQLEHTKFTYLINTEKLEYNYRVLTERDNENKATLASTKAQLTKLRENLSKTQIAYDKAEAKYKARNEQLTHEYRRVTAQFRELQRRLDQFHISDAARFERILNLHMTELTAVSDRLLKADKIICQQLLGIEWHPPSLASVNPPPLLLPSLEETMSGTSRSMISTKLLAQNLWNDDGSINLNYNPENHPNSPDTAKNLNSSILENTSPNNNFPLGMNILVSEEILLAGYHSPGKYPVSPGLGLNGLRSPTSNPPQQLGNLEEDCPSDSENESRRNSMVSKESETLSHKQNEARRIQGLVNMLLRSCGHFMLNNNVQLAAERLEAQGKPALAHVIRGNAILRSVGCFEPQDVYSLANVFDAALAAYSLSQNSANEGSNSGAPTPSSTSVNAGRGSSNGNGVGPVLESFGPGLVSVREEDENELDDVDDYGEGGVRQVRSSGSLPLDHGFPSGASLGHNVTKPQSYTDEQGQLHEHEHEHDHEQEHEHEQDADFSLTIWEEPLDQPGALRQYDEYSDAGSEDSGISELVGEFEMTIAGTDDIDADIRRADTSYHSDSDEESKDVPGQGQAQNEKSKGKRGAKARLARARALKSILTGHPALPENFNVLSVLKTWVASRLHLDRGRDASPSKQDTHNSAEAILHQLQSHSHSQSKGRSPSPTHKKLEALTEKEKSDLAAINTVLGGKESRYLPEAQRRALFLLSEFLTSTVADTTQPSLIVSPTSIDSQPQTNSQSQLQELEALKLNPSHDLAPILQFLNTIGPRKSRLWSSLEAELGKYIDLLQRRAKVSQEVSALRTRNTALREMVINHCNGAPFSMGTASEPLSASHTLSSTQGDKTSYHHHQSFEKAATLKVPLVSSIDQTLLTGSHSGTQTNLSYFGRILESRERSRSPSRRSQLGLSKATIVPSSNSTSSFSGTSNKKSQKIEQSLSKVSGISLGLSVGTPS